MSTWEPPGASAVVVAPCGKGRIEECFLGSVCTHCLHHCRAPLDVVPPDVAGGATLSQRKNSQNVSEMMTTPPAKASKAQPFAAKPFVNRMRLEAFVSG